MKKQKILALALAMSIAAGVVGTSSFVSFAAPYIQVQDASQVKYGTLTDKELDMINQYFDEGFYAAKYDDVAQAYGTDRALLLEHFVKCGIFEGREGWPEYRPEKVEVASVSDAEFVPVEVYEAANTIGVNDYATIEKALDSASEDGIAIVNSGEEAYAVVPADMVEQLENEEGVSNYKSLGTVSVKSGEFAIVVYKNANGYDTKLLKNDLVSAYFAMQLNCTNVVGFIPGIVHTVEKANALCKEWQIQEYEVNEGTVVGTEGVVITRDDQMVYLEGKDLDAPYARNMTNWLDAQYVNNAYSGNDVNGTADTEYEVGTVTEADDNGNVNVTTVIKDEETGFNYEVTYTFDGDPYKTEETAESTESAETATESVEETVEESVEE